MINEVKSVYFVGIKGVAMSGLAVILQKMGKKVAGSDVEETFITDEILQKNSIKVYKGFKEENITSDCDLIVYSASHNGFDNPEVQTGIKRNIKVLAQAELIGELMKLFKKNVAIVGCHGKTTTSSLLAHSLIQLGQTPSYLVGVSQFGDNPGADFQEKNYFVVEGDEYAVNPPHDKRVKFSFLNPQFVIATNIDFDHPDVYQNLQEVKKTFLNFFNKLGNLDKGVKRLYYCSDDINLVETIKTVSPDLSLSFGFSKDADLHISNLQTSKNESSFEVSFQKKPLGKFRIPLFGEKNISNSAGVILFLLNQGFQVETIKEAINNFKGPKRRFEQLAFLNNTYLFDDYAHHPAEILSVIHSVKNRFPERRLIIIFQPHTYSRTAILKDQFADALSEADIAYLLPIFSSARENSAIFDITSFKLEEIAQNKRKGLVKAFQNKEELLSVLKNQIRSGDIIFLMGAGDIYKLKNGIIKVLENV